MIRMFGFIFKISDRLFQVNKYSNWMNIIIGNNHNEKIQAFTLLALRKIWNLKIFIYWKTSKLLYNSIKKLDIKHENSKTRSRWYFYQNNFKSKTNDKYIAVKSEER